MAAEQNKHSLSRAQGHRRRAQASTRPQAATQIRRRINQLKSNPRKTTRPKSNWGKTNLGRRKIQARERQAHRAPRKPRKSTKRKKRERIDPRFRFTETTRGKTTIRRYSNRTFHQMKDFNGKVVELVQIFTSGDYNSISVRFQDKTSLDFAIDTGFTIDTDYTDWKTGNMRRIKRWPLIRSEPR